jgi:hypothetical protein
VAVNRFLGMGQASSSTGEYKSTLVDGAVHRVAEARDRASRRQRGSHPFLGPIGRGDPVEHVENQAVHRPVAGPSEGAVGGQDTGTEVRTCRCDDAGRERRGVEAVVDRERAIRLQGTGQGLILRAGEHPPVVGHVAQVGAGRARVAVVHRGDERR